MRQWTFLITAVFISSILLFACGSNEDGSGGDIFGSCGANADCESNMCTGVGAGTSGYCSMICNQDSECKQYVFDSCCLNNICAPASMCQTDGDNPDGDSTTECTTGQFRCSGNDVQSCADGIWSFYRTCANNQVCDEGECVAADGDTDGDSVPGECEAGEKRCNIDKVERCNVDREWELFEQCGIKQNCEDALCVTPQGDACTITDGCSDNEEYCLADELGGEDGHCMPYCGGDTNVVCPRGWACVRSVCEPIEGYCKLDVDCAANEFCDKLPNAEDGKCQKYCDLPGENCKENYECVTDTTDQDYGKCVIINPACNSCSYDDQCGAGFYCQIISGQVSGCCTESCATDDDCGGTLTCSADGRCVVGTGQQECPGGCSSGYICDKTFGQCVLNCPACGPDECCDESSAPKCYTCECTNPAVCGLLMPPCCFGSTCNTIIYGIEGFCI